MKGCEFLEERKESMLFASAIAGTLILLIASPLAMRYVAWGIVKAIFNS